jgi:hypothetical protein
MLGLVGLVEIAPNLLGYANFGRESGVVSDGSH